MATKSIKSEADKLVTRGELAKLLSGFAQSADAIMALKVAQMKAEIVQEIQERTNA